MDGCQRRIFEENVSEVIIYFKNKKTLKFTFSVFYSNLHKTPTSVFVYFFVIFCIFLKNASIKFS